MAPNRQARGAFSNLRGNVHRSPPFAGRASPSPARSAHRDQVEITDPLYPGPLPASSPQHEHSDSDLPKIPALDLQDQVRQLQQQIQSMVRMQEVSSREMGAILHYISTQQQQPSAAALGKRPAQQVNAQADPLSAGGPSDIAATASRTMQGTVEPSHQRRSRSRSRSRSRRRHTRQSSRSSTRSPRPRDYKTPDLSEKLDDGKSPTYEAWEIMLEGNLDQYSHHWTTERAQMNYVFKQTKGTAQSHLTQRMKSDHPLAFQSVDEMLAWLKSFFVDPNERDTARQEYRGLMMNPVETFNQFYSRFSVLSVKARIPASETTVDLFHKLTPELHYSLISLMATHPGDAEAIRQMQFHDNELRLARDKKRILRTTSRAAPPAPLARYSATPSASPAPQERSPARSPAPPTFRPGTTRSPSLGRDPAGATCYNCGRPGHISPDCPDTVKADHRIHEIVDSEDSDESGNEQP
jgi:hypothetical protein